MKISIIHASRSRPSQALHAYRQWTSSVKDRTNIQYILSIDTTDTPENKVAYQEIKPDVLLCQPNTSAIEAFNRGAQMATGDLIIAISDDFNIVPFHWDEHLTQMLRDKSDYIVKTDDGAQPWIITLPIMDKAYYKRHGYIYPPHIRHMFADTWMTHVADLLGKKITLPIRFKHNHYTTGLTPKDEINEKNDATWKDGEDKYLEGVRSNFGLADDEIKGVLSCNAQHIHWLQQKGINIEIQAA